MKKLGKYEILGELGRGAMGVVYRARDPVINRLVALKTITTGVAEDSSLLQRFYREAQSAGGLQHTNIVTIYDMGDERGIPYIAMELVDGENLEQVIARQAALPLTLKLIYAQQACRAFDYAHKRGIIHRDIKPGNVMVNKEGAVKVVDFGIARVLETSKTQTGMLIGTFAYMSPEQYHGEHADERSDIWSFGVLLYELLAYQKPFTGETPASLMHGICQREPRGLCDVVADSPKELEALMAKLLRKSPGDRCQSMEELLLELDPICKKLQTQSATELVQQSRQLIEQGDFTQARDLLRQALQVDSANSEARTLLDQSNAEIKRILIRPKAQQHVESGRSLLGEGKIQEAKAEAESALHLDSNYAPAQELRQRIQEEFDRAQLVAEWLQGAKQHLAEGMPDEAETLLAKVLEVEPSNSQAKVLRQQAIKEKEERKRRLLLLEEMQRARTLWTQQNYDECIELLTELKKKFPDEDEIPRLLQTAHEDQAEHHKKQILEEARNLLAVRRYDECLALMADLKKRFPNDEEIPKLLEDLREDQANQRRLQGLAEARRLLAGRNYDQCIALLNALQKEFANEDEIPKLLETARYDQAEQHKQEGVEKVRQLLAARRYEESLTALTNLKNQFPSDEEIPKLLNVAQHDEEEQRKIQGLAEARKLLAAKRYEESLSVLTRLQESFPNEGDIAKLLETAREDQAEHVKQQRLTEARAHLAARRFGEALSVLDPLQASNPRDAGVAKLRTLVVHEQAEHAKSERRERELEALKKMMAEKKYSEVLGRTKELLIDFPGDTALKRLEDFASGEQAQIENERLRHKAIEETRKLIDANRFGEAIKAADASLSRFRENPELLNLREQAKAQQKKQETRQQMEQRIREIKFKINREKFSDAINLAEKTLVALGPDTDVTQLLNSAQIEFEARERKRGQDAKVAAVRALIDAGNLNDATLSLGDAIQTKALDSFDPRVQRMSQEIKDAKADKPATSGLPKTPPPTTFSKEYAFRATPLPGTPGLQKPPLSNSPVPLASANQSVVQSDPSLSRTEAKQSSSMPEAPSFSAIRAASHGEATNLPIVPMRSEGAQQALGPPARAAQEKPASKTNWRNATVGAVLTVGLVVAVWLGFRFLTHEKGDVTSPQTASSSSPPRPQVNPTEAKQREALNAAAKLVASNELDQALATLNQAAALKGPLTVEIQEKISQINESMKDASLRQLRQREEVLWQQAMEHFDSRQYAETQKDLRQILALPAGGVRGDDAQKYLRQVIPQRQSQERLLARARQDLNQGEFRSARQAASEIQQNGGDSSRLVEEIDQAEQVQFSQLQNQFNLAKQGDDDAAVQQLKALQPKFQALADSKGPRSGEGQTYANSIPETISEVRTRAQNTIAEAAYQQLLQRYQQAMNASDKNALLSARTEFQSIAQGSGPHVNDAQKYLADIKNKLAALNPPPAPPPAVVAEKPQVPAVDKADTEAAIRGAIAQYTEAFDRRDPEALRKIWPAMGERYARYKSSFEMATSIHMEVTIQSIDMDSNNASAVVKALVSQDYTPKGAKTNSRKDTAVFQLSKTNGVWLITEVR